MEFSYTFIGSFLIVSVVSSFCVSIGIGGGILYVPILGYLYSDVPQGVYLSKISILVTSLIGVSYHLFNDIINGIKIYKNEKNNKEDIELGSNSNIISEYDKIPRLFIVLSMSLVPWCIVGSNVGTIFHFFAKNNLKPVVTSIVSLCLLVTLLKLFFIFRNRKLKLKDSEVSINSNPELIEDHIQVEMDSEDSNTNDCFIHRIFRPYELSEVHSINKRSIALVIMVICLILYYVSVRFEFIYVTFPIRLFIALVGLYYTIKVRLTFRSINYYSTKYDSKTEENIQVQNNPKTKFNKFLDTGVHFILLNTFIAFISGFFSGSIGIGSGIFMVPLLQFLKVRPISCTATANLLTLVMSIATLSRFSIKISLTVATVLPVVAGSFLGTSVSLFFIRSLTKDKITSLFVNTTLSIFCILSIIVTWVI